MQSIAATRYLDRRVRFNALLRTRERHRLGWSCGSGSTGPANR